MKKKGLFGNRFASASSILDTGAVVLDTMVCDISGSMDLDSFAEDRSKREVMGDAIRACLDIKRVKRPRDCLAIVAYQTTAEVCCPYLNAGTQYDQILAAIKGMEELPSAGTHIETGLQKARELVAAAPDCLDGGPPLLRILAYSDGYDQAEPCAVRLAQKLRGQGVLIETFGIGKDPSDVDEEFLKAIASTEDGYVHYRFLGSPDAVHETFERLAEGTLTFEG